MVLKPKLRINSEMKCFDEIFYPFYEESLTFDKVLHDNFNFDQVGIIAIEPIERPKKIVKAIHIKFTEKTIIKAFNLKTRKINHMWRRYQCSLVFIVV